MTALGAPHVLLGSAVLLVSGIIGLLGIGDGSRVFVAAVFAGMAGCVSGALAYGPLDAAGAAAVVVGFCALLLPAMPLLAVRLGKMPMPVLPRTAEDLVRDEPQPSREQVYQATARADEVLTGMIFGAAAVTIAGLIALTKAGTVASLLLAGIIAAAYLLRARLVPTIRHRVPMLTTGLTGVALVPLIGASGADTGVRVLALLPLSLLVAGVAVAAGRAYSRRAPSPRIARLGDIADILLQLSIVPVACSVLGLYSFMRALGG